MSWIGLRHKGLEPLFPDEWNRVVDALDILYGYTGELKETLDCIERKIDRYYLEVKSELDTIESKIDDLEPLVMDIRDIVRAIEERKHVKTLGYVIDVFVYADQDVFDTPLTVEIDGRVRNKIMADRDVLVKQVWIPKEVGVVIEAYLNAGASISGKAWHEFDFTVRKGDKVNIRVLPDSRVTIFIFNLGEVR